MNGAEIMVKALQNENVKEIFGYPGGAVLEVFEAIEESDIHLTLVRNEQGAAHAASGYARARGDVGVCLATSGPGATNLVTGIATAYMDSIPLVILTGQVAKRMIGTDAFQEIDITGITAPIVKYNILVQGIQDIPKIVAEAFHIAKTGRPGPVLIDLPRDVALDEIAEFKAHNNVDIRSYKPTLYGHSEMVKRAARLIARAEKMVIISGGGAITSGAERELLELAHLKKANVVTTMMGIGSYPSGDELCLGMLGTYGLLQANIAVQRADVILAVGTRLDDRIINEAETFAPQAKIIHIDIDPAEIGKNIKPSVPIVGDAKNVIKQILEALSLENINEGIPLKPDWDLPDCSAKAQHFLQKLYKYMEDETPFYTTDVGQHQVWAATSLHCQRHRQFISSCGLGTMGYGLPAAIGVQKAFPESRVILLTGDGSIQMMLSELGTLADEKLPIKIILFNNHCLGMVRQLQYHYCDKNYVKVHFPSEVDFTKLAEAYHILSLSYPVDEVNWPELEDVLKNDEAAIIEILIDTDDLCLPIALAGRSIEDMENDKKC